MPRDRLSVSRHLAEEVGSPPHNVFAKDVLDEHDDPRIRQDVIDFSMTQMGAADRVTVLPGGNILLKKVVEVGTDLGDLFLRIDSERPSESVPIEPFNLLLSEHRRVVVLRRMKAKIPLHLREVIGIWNGLKSFDGGHGFLVLKSDADLGEAENFFKRTLRTDEAHSLYASRKKWYFLRMESAESFQRHFFEQLGPKLHLAELFESLPEVYFYAKDRDSRIVKANSALVRLRGWVDERELIGKSDFDIHPRHLAERYVAEDQRVISTGSALLNQVWLIPDETGGLKWYLSSKIPLLGRDGPVIGVAGMLRDLRKFETAYRPYQAMDAVLGHVLDHYPERIEVPDLAAMVDLSVSQFDRRFKSLFQMTPREYVLRVRTDAAIHLLVTSPQSITEIALACGFYDQSSFGKQFRKRTGMTPVEYRRRYAESG